MKTILHFTKLLTSHLTIFMTISKQRHHDITQLQNTAIPNIVFSGDKQPTREQLEKMHHMAHENCFIANSVKTDVVTELLD